MVPIYHGTMWHTGLFPARQLCFRIMGALHPSPDHAMIVHLYDLSVKPLCQKGQQGTVQGEAIRRREALRHAADSMYSI